jgi:hypothetical protein
VEVFGTFYGFLSAVAAVIGAVAAVFVVMRQLVNGKASASIQGNRFALGQDRTNGALDEIKAALAEVRADVAELEKNKPNGALAEIKLSLAALRDEMTANQTAMQLDVWELQIRDPAIHIVQRAKIFGKYEAKGGSNRDLSVYYDSAVKPLLERHYREQAGKEPRPETA